MAKQGKKPANVMSVKKEGCCRRGELPWFPIILIVSGVLLLLDRLAILPDAMDTWWPIILIVTGFVWFYNGQRRK